MQATRTWWISSDESGINGARYYGFGSLWMPYERRGEFLDGIRTIRQKHKMPEHWEIKWANLSGHVRRSVALDVVEWFFLRPWLMFHCLIVRRSVVNKQLHRGGYDEARRKHLVMLLTAKMKQCALAHSSSRNEFRIWVDPIASSYKKADEAALTIAKRKLRKMFEEEHASVISLETHDSRNAPSIQLCDLLLGAVMDAWQGNATKEAKVAVATHIAERLGWTDLRADTWPTERKFNIWYFTPTTNGREVETRDVELMHPLPPRYPRFQEPPNTPIRQSKQSTTQTPPPG